MFENYQNAHSTFLAMFSKPEKTPKASLGGRLIAQSNIEFLFVCLPSHSKNLLLEVLQVHH